MCLHPRANPERLWGSRCANLASASPLGHGGNNMLWLKRSSVGSAVCTSADTWGCVPRAVGGRDQRAEPPYGLSTAGTRMECECGLRAAWQAQGFLRTPRAWSICYRLLAKCHCCIPVGEKKSKLTAPCEVKEGVLQPLTSLTRHKTLWRVKCSWQSLISSCCLSLGLFV